MSSKIESEDETTKEDFCGACIAAPIAMIGAGVTMNSASTKSQNKNKKKILLWSGISTAVISIIVAVYYLWGTDCEDCQ